jgi:D-beta-D-heptose 7-phosphate kinase/D-beta-D-heptose 1-phosphate adenosyltransferase
MDQAIILCQMSKCNLIPNFEHVRVLVYGDLMLDRYWYGHASRISPEAPVPVVHVRNHTVRPGGAANVALNVASLGGKVTVMGLVGDDLEAQQLREALQQERVDCEFLTIPHHPTVTKLRVIGQQQQLIRMDFEEPFIEVNDDALFEIYCRELQRTHVVVLSDYAKGALHHSQKLIQMARQNGISVLVDPKSRDLGRYRGATLITPNKAEFESIIGPWQNEDEMVEKAQKLIHYFELGGLLVTRGKDGMTLIQHNQPVQHFSAKAREVYDVTGAGDTVIGVIAAMISAGRDIKEAVRISNIAAGLVVMKLGAASVTAPELRRAVLRQGSLLEGILTEEELIEAVADARAHGETIVMTNGCFDILHAGHIQYLQQAKALGKRLIVAVNDDASVKMLKGPQRPLNSLIERMTVLSALRAVDWVVSFNEATPERLIRRIMPDVLVKGGDYKVEEVAGAQAVLAQGGVVKILDFLPGCSTTKLINKIQEQVI